MIRQRARHPRQGRRSPLVGAAATTARRPAATVARQADLRRGARAQARREGQAGAGVRREVPPGVAASSRSRALRLRTEISKDIERSRREVLAELLEVVDNLDRAIDARASRPARRRTRCCRASRWSGSSSSRSSKGFGVKRIDSDGAAVRSRAARSRHAPFPRRRPIDGRPRRRRHRATATASATTCCGRRRSRSRNRRFLGFHWGSGRSRRSEVHGLPPPLNPVNQWTSGLRGSY